MSFLLALLLVDATCKAQIKSKYAEGHSALVGVDAAAKVLLQHFQN